MANFYTPKKLLSLKDLKGRTPEIFMSTSNRSAGKTTAFNNMLLSDYKLNNNKFCLLVRFSYELTGCSETFFKDIHNIFPMFQNDDMDEKIIEKTYAKLFLNGENCGYVVPLNMADQIKRKSHLFSDTHCMLFDEFQSETNHYCPDEITKFQSIHQSIGRGAGKQSRYLPVYMLSNLISVLNPYFTALGVNDRLQPDTRFLRGNGWVLEQGFNKSALTAQSESLFNEAFQESQYIEKQIKKGQYLNDSNSFIEPPPNCKSNYLFTVIYKGRQFAIRRYSEVGIIYIDQNVDVNYPQRIALDNVDHGVNTLLYPIISSYIPMLREVYDNARFRFRDLHSKECAIKLLRYY